MAGPTLGGHVDCRTERERERERVDGSAPSVCGGGGRAGALHCTCVYHDKGRRYEAVGKVGSER